MNIKKGEIKNVVSLAQFEKIYKPNGWVVDDSVQAVDEMNQTIKTLKTEAEAKNFLKMKKVKDQHFNDGLFYSEEEGR